MHSPGQVEEGFVSSDRIHSPLGDYLRFERWKELRKPYSHALEHLCVGVEWQHCGAADTGTVQQPKRQALHERQ